MERFIAKSEEVQKLSKFDLKSSMERFIAEGLCKILLRDGKI